MTLQPGKHTEPILVKEIGEFALIERLRQALPVSTNLESLPIGIGDDAAIWNPGPDRQVVVSTDALVDGNHFRLDWTDWRSLGHKMLAVNLSDLAAMGAKPGLGTVTLGLTGEEVVNDLVELYRGAGALADKHGVAIAGGDIVRSPRSLFMSVTAMGTVQNGASILRSGAGIGDVVVVSGTLGASAAGMALIERGQDDSATGELLRAAHLRPNPRLALGALMHTAGVTSAMDLSDGLLGDLPKILEASGVSANIDLDRLPILPAVRALFPDRFEQFASRGGEDYELLMTIPPQRFDAFAALAENVGATLTPIGEIVDRAGQSRVNATRNGQEVDLGTGAFDHFGG